MTGKDDSYLTFWQTDKGQKIACHPQVKDALRRMLDAAQEAGLEIHIVSGFRSFERQLKIWNEKWQGHRPVWSRHGRPLDVTRLSPMEKYKAIALYSALPGMSRHHWGTDFDIFLQSAVDEGYPIKLDASEFAADGPCAALESWLQANLHRFGFFRPYQVYQGGVAAEPWHISAIPLAEDIRAQLSLANVKAALQSACVCDGDWLINQLEHYKQNFFDNISRPTEVDR